MLVYSKLYSLSTSAGFCALEGYIYAVVLVPPLLLVLAVGPRWGVLRILLLHVLLLWRLLLWEVLPLHRLRRCLDPSPRHLHLRRHLLLREITGLLSVHLRLAGCGESHARYASGGTEALRSAHTHHTWRVVALRVHALRYGHLLLHVLHLHHLKLASLHLALLLLHLSLILLHHALIDLGLHCCGVTVLLLGFLLLFFAVVDVPCQAL